MRSQAHGSKEIPQRPQALKLEEHGSVEDGVRSRIQAQQAEASQEMTTDPDDHGRGDVAPAVTAALRNRVRELELALAERYRAINSLVDENVDLRIALAESENARKVLIEQHERMTAYLHHLESHLSTATIYDPRKTNS